MQDRTKLNKMVKRFEIFALNNSCVLFSEMINPGLFVSRKDDKQVTCFEAIRVCIVSVFLE